jgi:hypothetical protein
MGGSFCESPLTGKNFDAEYLRAAAIISPRQCIPRCKHI